nr:polysaccharide pyruvyl transferase family protein [uncultured Prevotella sp.]
MKIGILTFHLAHNYGAVLQCFALQETLRGIGHDVMVVNYQQPYVLEQFKPKRLMGVRSFVRATFDGNLKQYLHKGFLPFIKKHNFDTFRKCYLNESVKCYGTEDIPEFELYIVGSDQPWNPDLTGGADLVYWGQFCRGKNTVLATYAMSGSLASIGKVGWDNVTRYCASFDFLSFREDSLKDKIAEVSKKTCVTSLDPTLLASADIWKPMINTKWSKRKYVLLYHVGGPADVIETMTKEAQNIAAHENVDFIDLSRYLYSPSDFVSLIKYAQCIVTASFHAMVFSIIFKKPFVVVKTGQASDVRFHSLLGKLHLENQCLKAPGKISISRDIDYSQVDTLLDGIRIDSMTYLKKITTLCNQKDN